MSDWKIKAAELLRLDPEQMNHQELDLAMALLLQKPTRLGTNGLEVDDNGRWLDWAPTSNPGQLLEVLAKTELVVSSHSWEEDGKTCWRYRCHGFMSGIDADTGSLSDVIGCCCAKLLKWRLKYQE